MINALYALKKEYQSKKIYIWNINIDSLGLLMRVKFGGSDIQGFVAIQEEYVGKTYLKYPIISLKQAEMVKDCLILVSDEVSQRTINMLPADKVLCWNTVSGFNETMKKSKIIIYGIGKGAEQLQTCLNIQGITVDMYCLTKRKNVRQYKEKPVIEVTQLEMYVDYAVVISVQTRQYRSEILEELASFGGQIYLDLEYLVAGTLGGVASPLQNLNMAMKMHKVTYLYSTKSIMAEFLKEFMEGCGIEVGGYVYDIGDKMSNVKGIQELVIDGVEDKVIVLHGETYSDLIKAREIVEKAGFSLEKKNYTCFQWGTRASERALGQLQEYPDPLLGKSIKYAHGEFGWKMYGEVGRDKIIILILGNSTSSEDFYIENWVSKLYSKLKRRGIGTVIYNGAHSINDISAELLRFLRDGNVLKPQIVISMSGVNNLYYKDCENQFNQERVLEWVKALSTDNEYCSGVYSDESLYHFWIRNEKILKIVSEFYGAHFFCFLQPMSMAMRHMSLQEKSLYEQERRIDGALEFNRLANCEEGYVNLMQLFEHQGEMFIDFVHHTDKGNEIIADRVCKEILPVLNMLGAVGK